MKTIKKVHNEAPEFLKVLEFHTRLLRNIEEVSKSMASHSCHDEIELLEIACRKREGLLGIVLKMKEEIEQRISQNPRLTEGALLSSCVDNWRKCANQIIESVRELDQNTILKLESDKDKLMTEINMLTSNRLKLKGYNLKDVKR